MESKSQNEINERSILSTFLLGIVNIVLILLLCWGTFDVYASLQLDKLSKLNDTYKNQWIQENENREVQYRMRPKPCYIIHRPWARVGTDVSYFYDKTEIMKSCRLKDALTADISTL